MTAIPQLAPLTRASLETCLRAPRVQAKRALGKDRALMLKCAAGLEAQADIVLEVVLRGLQATSRATLEVGPSEITLRPRDKTLVCYEPDYLGADPLNDIVDDATLTCLLFGHQVRLSMLCDVQAEDASLFDAVMVDRRALTEDLALLRRNLPDFERHTGWYLISGSALQEDDPPYQPMAAYELLRARPSLVAALALPTDCIAQFRGERLVEVVDADNRPLYRA